jgi:hypothetical protein
MILTQHLANTPASGTITSDIRLTVAFWTRIAIRPFGHDMWSVAVQRPPVRFKLSRIMALIGVCALIFAAYRIDAAPAAGLLIFVSSGLCLAYRRCEDELGWRAAQGQPASRFEAAEIFVSSALVSFTIIGLADLAFLVGFFGYAACWRRSTIVENELLELPDLSPEHILAAMACGSIMALLVASFLRWAIWPMRNQRSALDVPSSETSEIDSGRFDATEPPDVTSDPI